MKPSRALVKAKMRVEQLESKLAEGEEALKEITRQRDIAQSELKYKSELVASKNETIIRESREKEVLQLRLNDKTKELERFDRLVDQFLSVQIVRADASLTVSGSTSDSGASERLRNTSKPR